MFSVKSDQGANLSKRDNGKRIYISVLLFSLILSVALNVLLARQLGQQRRLIENMTAPSGLLQNESVPSFSGKDPNGNPFDVTYSANMGDTILYIFSPDCGWCTKNIENIRTLSTHINSSNRFIGISLSSENLKNYLIQCGFNIPVITNLDKSTIAAYKFGGTPQTLVISSDGRVLQNWSGAYKNEIKDEIESYFGVKLSGTTE